MARLVSGRNASPQSPGRALRAVATEWYRLAADQGHSKAQDYLGVMHDEGRGVSRDDVIALMWTAPVLKRLIEALAALWRMAADFRNMLARRMTADQLAEAKRRAGAWRPVRIVGSP